MALTCDALIHALPTYRLVVLCSVSIYLFLILGFRYLGRRQLGQLTVIDLVIIVIMGSAVETAMIHGDVGLGAGLVCATTLMITNRTIALLSRRYRVIRKLVSFGPVLLVSHGHVVEEHLKRAGLTYEDVCAAIRTRGYSGVADVGFAIMEEDGEITVIPKSAKTLVTEESIRSHPRLGPDNPHRIIPPGPAPTSP